MSPEDRDAAHLWDIIDAARDIISFTDGKSFHDFSNQKILRFAVERQLIVIGEAAKRLSEHFKALHPEIPWGMIIAQRNIIAHEYGEILVERIWHVAKEKLPPLLEQLTGSLPDAPKA